MAKEGMMDVRMGHGPKHQECYTYFAMEPSWSTNFIQPMCSSLNNRSKSNLNV